MNFDLLSLGYAYLMGRCAAAWVAWGEKIKVLLSTHKFRCDVCIMPNFSGDLRAKGEIGLIAQMAIGTASIPRVNPASITLAKGGRDYFICVGFISDAF
jgi:hypothetical protein